MPLSIYRAAALARLEEFVDPETGEIDHVGWQSARIVVIEQLRAFVAAAKNREMTIDALKAAEGDLRSKRERIERTHQQIKMRLAELMRLTCTSEVVAEDGSFSAKLYRERDDSVVIEEGAIFSAELCFPPKPPEPSKKLIKDAILSGVPVAGARIIRRDRLTIR